MRGEPPTGSQSSPQPSHPPPVGRTNWRTLRMGVAGCVSAHHGVRGHPWHHWHSTSLHRDSDCSIDDCSGAGGGLCMVSTVMAINRRCRGVRHFSRAYHGVELPSSDNPFAYAVGFVIATGLIHLAGIGFGLALGKAMDGKVSRAAGAAISLAGVYYFDPNQPHIHGANGEIIYLPTDRAEEPSSVPKKPDLIEGMTGKKIEP
jgi:hypothetical protein